MPKLSLIKNSEQTNGLATADLRDIFGKNKLPSSD
jgi:hypothetical protein